MQKISEGLKEVTTKITESKILFRALCGLGVLVIFSVIFSLGVEVGFRKASFGRAWEEHYMQNFGRNPMRPNFGIGKDMYPNAHGAVGKIIKIELPNIMVADKDNIEKTVAIGNDTNILQGPNGIKDTDLKMDDFVVVIGNPDANGIIDAKFIRVIPSPEFLPK